MKKRKTFAALILAVLMAFCSVAPAYAASSTTTTTSTAKKTGWVTKSGKKYYYKNGKRIKNKLGYKIGKKYYRFDAKGVATRVSEAEGLAGIRLEKVGKKLIRAFRYSSTQIKYRANCGKPAKGQAEADYYAIYGFKYGYGDCYVMSATFYQMAKVLGYDAHYMKGGFKKSDKSVGAHSWVEIVRKGKTRVYDPNFAYSYRNVSGAHSGYNFVYGAKGTLQYVNKKRVN